MKLLIIYKFENQVVSHTKAMIINFDSTLSCPKRIGDYLMEFNIKQSIDAVDIYLNYLNEMLFIHRMLAIHVFITFINNVITGARFNNKFVLK